MKKLLALTLAAMLVLCITACDLHKYNVEIANDYPIANTLKSSYKSGEEITVKLETITEHYYVLLVNGVRQEQDRAASDMMFTYFTFIMPAEDVLIEIEDRWVDIPEAPQL